MVVSTFHCLQEFVIGCIAEYIKANNPFYHYILSFKNKNNYHTNNNNYHEWQWDHAPHTVWERHPHQHHPVHQPKGDGTEALPPSWVAEEIKDTEEPQADELGWTSITLLGTLPACYDLPFNNVLKEYCRRGRREGRKLHLRHIISHHV